MAKRQVVVLGAGVVGLSSARRLLAAGCDVTVLDRTSPGGMGSHGAAGVAIPSVRLLDDPEMLAFTRAGMELIHQELDALVGPGGLRRGQGIIRAVMDEKSRDELTKRAEQFPALFGRWVGRDELIRLEPAMEGTPLPGGFLSPEGRMVETDGYLAALRAAVTREGGTVRLGVGVEELREGESTVEVRGPEVQLEVEDVVVCSGAWAGSLPGVPRLPIKPMRGQMLTVQHPFLQLSRIISGPMYLAPWRAGQVVVGATEEDAGFEQVNTAAGLLQLGAALARLAPQLREARVDRTWAGLRSASASGRPIIGRYPGKKRCWVAAGHGGQGILTGAVTGRCVAELLTTGKSELAAPFDPSRALG